MKTKIFTFIIAGVMALIMMAIPGMSAFAQSLPTGGSLQAPHNLTVELKQWPDGRPYFALQWTNPQSIWELQQYALEIGEAGAEYQIDMKIGDGKWLSEQGKSLYGNALPFDEELDQPGNYVTDSVECDPVDLGVEGTVDIRANVYQLRVRYAYLAYSDDAGDHWVYGPFSNVAAIGTGAFYKKASEWAKPELQKAHDLGLIPDILKGADLTRPITREEFCELAVVLYEKVTGQKAQSVSPNPFKDTSNPQILKAYNIGITAGTSPTTFSPKVLINREQCAAMLFRTIKAIHPQGDYSVAGVRDFPDQKYISSWAVEAAKYMSKMGIISGDAKGNFMPKATTPAQMAAGYGMATREQAIALSLRTSNKMPDIRAAKTSGKAESITKTDASPVSNLNSLISKATAIDTGYFESVSEVQGYTIETKYWKKGSMVKKVETGGSDNKTKIDIFDMSKGEAYSYFEGSAQAVKSVYAVSDPSKYINPFNITGPLILGSMEESVDVKITGNETVDGVSCSVITITIDGKTVGKIWVSEDGLKRRSETLYFGFPMTTVYKNYKIGASISDSEFKLPAGMTVDENVSVTIKE